MRIRVSTIISILLLYSSIHLYAQESKPMSCDIRGKIISIVKTKDKDEKSPCSKYPCKAMVKILNVHNCGSSVTTPINIGDIIEVNFAYTLHKTKKIFPAMPKKYPGMKKGKVFTASAEQRNKIGGTTEFVVYGYTIKKDSN